MVDAKSDSLRRLDHRRCNCGRSRSHTVATPRCALHPGLILGLAGALIGGFVAGLLSLGPGTTLETQGIERVLINLVISIVGAVILLFLGNTLMRRR